MYFALLFLAPFLFAFSPQEKPNISRSFFQTMGFVFCTYAFGMGLFLVGGIREFAQTSLVTALFLSAFAISFSLPTYILPQLSRLFFSDSARFYLWLGILSLAAAAYPNMGNMGPGEVLAQYAFFQPLVRVLGTSCVAALYHFLSLGSTRAALTGQWLKSVGMAAVFLALAFGAFISDGTLNPSRPLAASFRMALVQTMNLASSIEKGEIQVKSAEKMTIDLFAEIEARIAQQPVDALILPESGLNVEFSLPWDVSLNERLAPGSFLGIDDFLSRHQAYLIAEFSGQRWADDGTPLKSYLPAAWLYSKNQGHLIDFSYKYHLVPFIEYVPGGESSEAWRKLFPWAWALKSDMRAKSFTINDIRFRTLICYDNLFSEAYFDARKDGAQFLVSLTNNASLHDGGHYQYAIARARTIESGMPMVYVGNYGDTGIVGGIRTPANQFALVDVNASKLTRHETFYAEFLADALEPFWAGAGSVVVVGFWLAFILLGLFSIRGRRRYFKVYFVTYVLPVTVVVSAYYLITANVIQYVYVPTSSMYPSIEPGSKIWICRYRSVFNRGDTLSAQLGADRRAVLKRLILLPGERLVSGGKIVSGSGAVHQISYQREHDQCFESIGDLRWAIACEDMSSLSEVDSPVMKADEYFLMGDNRKNSADSRYVGPVKRENIKGVRCAQ